MSVLPIVDEFVVALGNCEKDDKTREEILSIGSDKIRIIDTVWDTKKFQKGTIHAQQTDLAKAACKGQWLLYVQADEVIHEKDHAVIVKACKKYSADLSIEGFAFDFIHFWADYHHFVRGHGWYDREIRIIRNDADIHSWKSAQSFRRIPHFDGLDFRQTKNAHKLKVIVLNANIYHYGYVRPPSKMVSKKKILDTTHQGERRAVSIQGNAAEEFDYGPLRLSSLFNGSHPAVMSDRIAQIDWHSKLRHHGPIPTSRPLFKHEKIKYRLLTFIEDRLFGHRRLWGRKNFIT